MIASFKNATFCRGDGIPILNDISWTWNDGETWAITGPSGCGKSAFAEALAGRLRLLAGTMTRPEGTCVIVAFQESSRSFNPGQHYYQQRYEFADADEPITLMQYLKQDLLQQQDDFLRVAKELKIDHLLNLSFMKLSTGQMRRAKTARGLLRRPDVLILDDPFLGIDVDGRAELATLLGTLIQRGQKLLLICRPDDVPSWVTVVYSFPMSTDLSLKRERRLDVPPSLTLQAPEELRKIIVELVDVTVCHGGRTILDNFSWTVREGERWALVGPNGVGKTTLLSLVVGDHPQAFSNAVKLFGVQRGSGETLWDIKRQVGFVSPEFHLYFAEDLTAAEAAETGFTDTLLHRPVTAEQAAIVQSFFDAFGIADLASKRMRRLSTGQQRLALLIRALVKSPPLLVLDEPYQGLDATTIQRVNDWLETHLSPRQTMIMTTHRSEELPRCVTLIKQLHPLPGASSMCP